MLIIIARNVSNLQDISDYDVTVLINDRVIDHGFVHGHARADGWQALAAKIGAEFTSDIIDWVFKDLEGNDVIK